MCSPECVYHLEEENENYACFAKDPILGSCKLNDVPTALMTFTCLGRWREFEGKCYKFFNEQVTWQVARRICLEQNVNIHLKAL